MTTYQTVEYIPVDWLDRAAWWPGLQVYSRPVKVPLDVPCPARRKTDAIDTIDTIEQLLKEAFDLEGDNEH